MIHTLLLQLSLFTISKKRTVLKSFLKLNQLLVSSIIAKYKWENITINTNAILK